MQEPFEEYNEDEENKNGENEENLRMENEIKKIKLSLEHGADLSKQLSDAELPPEIEGKFLDYIQQFEDEFAKKQTILVYDLAGMPEYKPEAEIPDDEIAGELDRIIKILESKSIAVNTVCEVPERELYRFITEELFKVETNDIRIPGMTHGFIYEEFHPNHENDIKNRVTELVEYLFDKEKENAPDLWELADTIEVAGKTLTKSEFLAKTSHFRDAFSAFTMHEFTIESAAVNEDDGYVTGSIRYEGNIEGCAETLAFEGRCTFHLRRQYDWWNIYQLQIPGVAI